jgi:hypothetical protein
MARRRLLGGSALALILAATPALAQAPPPPAARPASYSLPWLLRPAVPSSVIRLDETMAFYEDPGAGTSGSTYVTSLVATWKASPAWVPIFREIWVSNDAPSGGKDASGRGFSNPLLGINYLRPFRRGWRFSAFLASTVPIGSGGGDHPDAGAAAAMTAGISARSAMDNALFAVDYWTVIGGLGVARITPGATLQAEVTVLQLTHARGPETADQSRTNLTAGLHAGHFFSPRFSLGAEVRMQRWMTDAAPVRNDPAAREQFTAGLGPRLHFQVGGKHWVRPGLSYTRALDDAMAKKGYDIVQIDVPFAF